MLAASPDIDDLIFSLEYSDTVSPISKAAKAGDLSKIKKLISKGSLPQTPDNRGWTSIHHCVAAKQIEALKLILKLKPKNKKYLVNLKTWENISPLLIALRAPAPSLEIVKVLLKAKADPNECTLTKVSPLHLACLKKGTIDCIKLLVQFGANVNVQEDLSLFTPLHFAVCKGLDLQVIKFLIGLSDLSLVNIYERTAFLEACNSNYIEAVELFLEWNKDLANVKTALPPIVYAGLLGNLKMAELLIESGADVNCRCKAIVSCKSSDSDLILFDKENFLPIHSSLNNIDVFTLFLKLTNSNKLLELETNYYSFPVFVMIYGNEILYEKFLQSDLISELKNFSCEVFVKYILNYPDMEEIIFEKFQTIFKYNFSLTPENMFNSFAIQISKDVQSKSVRFLYLLARMGISSANNLLSRNVIINYLEGLMTRENDSVDLGLVKSTYDLLFVKVLTLKQLCRVVFRSHIKSAVKNDLLALNIIKELNLPEFLKKFVLFESVD